MMTSVHPIHHDTEKQLFYQVIDHYVAQLHYTLQGDTLVLDSTQVPDELSGQGVAKGLVDHAVAYIREQHLFMVPECRYVKGYVEKHRESLSDILKPE